MGLYKTNFVRKRVKNVDSTLLGDYNSRWYRGIFCLLDVLKLPYFKVSVMRYITNPNFLMREIGGECVLVPVGDAGVFDNSLLSLNSSCSFLWKCFQDGCTVEEAVEKAMEHFDGEREIIEQDVKLFVNEYKEYHLLEEA